MQITYRPIVDGEQPALYKAVHRGFGGDPTEADADGEHLFPFLPTERTVAAFAGERIVGTLGDYDLHVTVPRGRSLPMAGTTIVTVAATHRRRGVLTSMMRSHLETALGRGDPLAGLWASEAPIYGRFGYGAATDRADLEVDGAAVDVPAPPDVVVDVIEDEEAADVIPGVYDSVYLDRPGALRRADLWWEHRHFHDPERRREGGTAQRYAVALRSGRPVGFATYRQKQKWEDLPEGSVNVIEIHAADDDARRALWGLLTSIDLYPKVRWWNAPVDEPLPWEVADRRRIRITLWDALWLRVLDVPAALEGRSYERDGRVVLDVSDEFLPAVAGRFELEVAGGEAACSATSAEADVSLDIRELGALYLGGRSAHVLAGAGLVYGGDEAVATLDELFRTARAPWCPEVF